MGTTRLVHSNRTSRLLANNLVRFRLGLSFVLVASVCACVVAGCAEDSPPGAATMAVPELQTGFRFLYQQRFPEARQTFLDWEGHHPDDPFGHAAVAAGYLFEEFYRQGVLTSGFFLDDRKFLHGIDGTPDPARIKDFYAALDRTRLTSRARMTTNPNDPEALFSLTLASGMQADALSLLEHKQLESLKHIKEAENTAEKLLAQHPDAVDAWLALGAAHYVIGCLPRPKRFVLWFGDVRGDRKLGMEELTRAASGGSYLRPFAKILLALAARREKKDELARDLLRELNEEFPSSPLFAAEYDRAISHAAPAQVPR